MFSLDELRQKIDRYLDREISLSELEDWFSIESWNVHQWGSEEEIERVFSLESLFSKYHFEELGESGFRTELAKPIRPFVHRNYRELILLELGEPKYKSSRIGWGEHFDWFDQMPVAQ
jgi:hypothetical protein